eukprot:6212338-Pleurochrysis_carterae.AAC.1
MMIADTMTYRGYIMPLSRHGLNRTDTGPLVRSSFEETIETLYEAALFNERDCGRGVTQNIMTGQTPRAGTGALDVQLKIQKQKPTLHRGRAHETIVKSVSKSSLSGQATGASCLQTEQVHSTLEYVSKDNWNWRRVSLGEETQNYSSFPNEKRSFVDMLGSSEHSVDMSKRSKSSVYTKHVPRPSSPSFC